MIYVLTSDTDKYPVQAQIGNDNTSDSFMLSICHQLYWSVGRSYRSTVHGFELFHDAQNPYANLACGPETEFQLRSHTVSSMEEGLDQIINLITSPDKLDVHNTIAVAVPFPIARKVTSYLNLAAASKIAERSGTPENPPREVDVLNLYQYLSVPSSQKLADRICQYLGTDKVNPNDPLTFGYAISYALTEGLI